MRYLGRLHPLALLVMRLTLGTIMSVHGDHKVLAASSTSAHMVRGVGLPGWLSYVSACTELVGGLLLLVGLFTRPAAFAICINLCIAIWKLHLLNGLMGSPNRPGFEFLFAAATRDPDGPIFLGAGPISIDHVLRGGGSGSSG